MPHGKTKFQTNWLDKELDGIALKEWLTNDGNSIYSAKCKLCGDVFDISGSGFSQVKSHHSGKKHKSKFHDRFKSKSSLSKTFQHNEGTSGSQNTLSIQMQVIKAETIWALRVADSNMSFKSCTENVELFKIMFPTCEIASQMQLKEKKVAYVISHGISKHFEDGLKGDISKCSTKYTIAFDETTNVQVKKQLDVYLRYWSPELNYVSSRYLTSVFLGHANADIILKEMLDILSSFSISIDKIICISMDNPNVNKSFLKKFNDTVIEETGGKGTVPLGACNLHVANNAFKNLLNSFDDNFEEFATDIHFFLKYSAARREDYQCVEDVTQETAKFFLKHVSSRWLTTGPVAQRLLDQWKNMCEYFLKFLPSQKSQEKKCITTDQYKRIVKALNNPTMPSFLAFIIFMHKYFETFSLCFQSKEPKVHLLYEEMNKLIRNVMQVVVKDDVVNTKHGNDLDNINLEDNEIFKKRSQFEVGMRTKNLLQEVKENDKKRFLMGVRKSIISVIGYLKLNLPFNNQILKDLEILRPIQKDMPVTNGLYAITRIASYLRFSEDVIDSIRREWTSLMCDTKAHDTLPENTTDDIRIDIYWRNLASIVDNNKRPTYFNLLQLIKTALILPHGNADPERGFSINNAMIKANYADHTIKCLRLVKDTIKSYGGVHNVPITTSLLNEVKNSYKAYQQYMEKKKEEEEKLRKEKKEKEKESSEKKENLKRKLDCDEKIKDIDKQINSLKNERCITLGIIGEGTERLSKGIAEKNNPEISIASALISQATEQLKKLETELNKIEQDKSILFQKRMKHEN